MPDQEYKAILDEARAQIARGVEPDAAALEARIGAVPGGDAEHALAQLRRLLSVHRARALLVDPPAAAPSAPPRRPGYRARPTIAANIAVRARRTGDTVTLEWEPAPGVARWEARRSERPDARSDYVERETLALEAPHLELLLAEQPTRVHLFGRSANGRLVQRAVISGLTSDNWSQRWRQRASAS
jgi:hypothetical protein